MEKSNLMDAHPLFENEKVYFKIDRYKVDMPISMPRCHYHNGYEIYYLHQGERLYFIRDKMYHIKKGDFVLIPPNEIHATLNMEDRGFERSLISFNKEYVERCVRVFGDINFFECFEKNSPIISITPHEQVIIEDILDDILEKDAKNSTPRSYFQFMLLQLLYLINTHHPVKFSKFDDVIPSSYKTVTSVMGYINNNFAEDLSLDIVSERFFISECYLSRLFKKSVGISFVDYVNNIRIKEAKYLLLKTDSSIIKISETVGYKSNTHFGRIFKNITGLSPLQYRKKMR